MSETYKHYLIQEAKMQARALERIAAWRRAALSVAGIGILLAYIGFVTQINILRGVFGIVTAVLGGGIALLIHIGYKNGKRNVEHILKAVQK